MTPPFHGFWFPAVKTILIAEINANVPSFLYERESVDRLGPRASGERRCYWELPARGVTALVPVNASAVHEFCGTTDGRSISLTLDASMTGDENLLLVSHRVSTGEPRLQFIAGEAVWPDASGLHQFVRQALDLDKQDHVEAVWTARVEYGPDSICLGPAQPAWPHGKKRFADVRPHSMASLRSGLEWIARADHFVALDGDDAQMIPLSPTDPGSLVLLAWRSVFASRMTSRNGSALLEVLQKNTSVHLGQPIPFNRIPTRTDAIEVPIVRGYFHPSSGTGTASVQPGQPVSLKFQGPLDVDDVLVLGVRPRILGSAEVVRHFESTLQPFDLKVDGLECPVLCWLTTVDGLIPTGWNDLDMGIRAAVASRLESELRKCGQSTLTSPDSRTALATAETRARAAAQRAPLLESTSLFSITDELRGVLDEWFATLDSDLVVRLHAQRAHETIPFTNMTRFLPVVVDGMLAAPANWAVFERDAAALQKQLASISRILASSSELPSGHLRNNAWIWRLIRQAVAKMEPRDGESISTIEAFLPNASGSLAPIDPTSFYRTTQILIRLEDRLMKPPNQISITEPQAPPET